VIGTEGHPEVLGLEGWQWVYIAWGIPAVVLGVIVFFALTDRPSQAKWLEPEEREALQAQLDAEHREAGVHKMTVIEGLKHPKVLLLALAYFFVVTGNYGIEFFLPSILQQWYGLRIETLAWLVMLPPMLALVGQLVIGWSSDRTKERRWHTVGPIVMGGLALLLVTQTQGSLPLTILLFMVAAAGFKAYLPAFWSLPNIFLTRAAAAGSIGFINSVGNLGGFLGPYVIGTVETVTGSFVSGIMFLGVSALASALTVFLLGLGARTTAVAADLRPATR
jgi:ACS family tartrate transporter-like MFS transporter